ncbi:putative excinuclease subunit [Xanthomonas oryzae pv. oryzicola BLS256]|uniref:Putative excinuclease subunit n=1 Tax=Xanthomonas oryzae pv. oryzicola (strain BLS256) TaxID=383407 RepID=G7TAT3_XANOB|nr:putative excinuclease subunit [Xanthomonas oryzae pv. oryzicola BLS256]
MPRDRHSLGSTSALTAARNVKAGPGDFDRDRSWILRRGLERRLHNA